MNKQEAMICIAKMNRYSKQVVSNIETDSPLNLNNTCPEIAKVAGWGESILSYLHKNPSYGVTNEISFIHDPSKIYLYLKGNRKLKAETKILLKEFVNTVNQLLEYADRYQKQYRKGPYEKLVNELAYKEAKDVFVRIREAGFLTDDFKLKNSTSRVQSFVLGWSIIKLLKLPKRKSWAVLERQWECGRIDNIALPEQKTRDIDKVKGLFPELDYSALFCEPSAKYFDVKCGEDVLMEVFLAFVARNFISNRTKFENFRMIFSANKTETFKPVNWIGSVRYLTYFVHYAFAKTNRKYLEITRYCFTVKGKPLNKGTLKSTTSLSVRQDDGSNTLVGLKQIALKLASRDTDSI